MGSLIFFLKAVLVWLGTYSEEFLGNVGATSAVA